MKRYPYLAVALAWLAVAIFSACSPPAPLQHPLTLTPQLRFSGISDQEKSVDTPIAAICFDERGTLYTLAQDSGRITAFDENGVEKMTCVLDDNTETDFAEPAEALALGSSGDKMYMLAGKTRRLQIWHKNGELLGIVPVTAPLSPGDTAFGADGLFYHNTEGLSEDSLIVAIDASGTIRHRLGVVARRDILQQQDSLRRALARGEIPAVLQNSVLVATGPDKRVYAVHRTMPLLKCYQNGILLYERVLEMSELHDIRQAVEIRNRLLDVPASYIPLSYWSDIATAADGSIFILLALQNRHTVYKLDSDGTVLQKFTGDYGKGHLLAVHQNRLAIADAAGQQVTLYALP